MTSRDFCYWLQGYFEITNGPTSDSVGMTASQIDLVRKHLAIVFKHEIDPSMGDEKHQAELDKIHGPLELPKIRC